MLMRLDAAATFPPPPLAPRIHQLAERASQRDHTTPLARVAIVAPMATGYGLARMYLAYRELTGGVRPLQVFHEEGDAWDWLAAGRA
jgi:hypothetical protein